MPSGSSPDRVNSSVWHKPVALISHQHLTGAGALKHHVHNLKRFASLQGDCGTVFMNVAPLSPILRHRACLQVFKKDLIAHFVGITV